MDIIPIWRDYPIEIPTTEDYVDYSIKLGSRSGETIYSGRAFQRPGNGAVKIVPNEICAPYVAVTGAPPIPTPLPPDDDKGRPQPFLPSGMAQQFTLTKADGTVILSFIFQADYSHIIPTHAACAPITGKVDRNQVLILASYSTSIGINMFTIQLFDAKGDMIGDYTDDTPSFYTGALLRGKVLDGVARVHTWGRNLPVVSYDIVDACDPYILYYVNAYGAWDSLLVDGTVKETDDYNRTTYKQSYSTVPNQTGVLERGTVCLQNNITRKYSLVTGWLTDDQASRMHHLLGSTNVYLLDRNSNQYLPVVLTNSSCEYKTFRNQGAKLVNYTIEATVAQNFIRR